MILVDANILLYAHVGSYPQHAKASAWLDEKLNGQARVGLPWISLLAFARILTNPRVFARSTTVPEAWEQIDDWLKCETVWIPQPTERHTEVLGSLIRLPGMSSALVSDAHLAAMAIEHGLTLCSSDGDFARFPGLRWHNPLLS